MFKSIPTLCICLCFLLASAQADPMRPDPSQTAPAKPAPRPAPKPEPRLTLTSIYILGEQRNAIINGRWLTLDDTLHNYRVVAIRPDEVVLRRGSQTRRLTLSQAGDLSITETNED